MSGFTFLPFEEMTESHYAEVGFKSGLEVHQQLLTDKKLFCRCPAGKYTEEYNAELLRHMRPTLSELGEYDGTALMEFKTAKDIIYRIHHDSVCTYEMDDTPPFMINEQALDIALGIGLLFNSTTVDELHIARKQYLDGSIPTGFQRTAIYCVNGHIPYGDREIEILQMSIEEDSCRETSDIGHERIYKTDRLGMPLIEAVTAPQMKTPQEVAEVCEIIRKALRSTGWVRTGAGATRQDVNVSVTGGTRVEIKGVSSIKAIPLLTYYEAMRQWNLLRLRDELHNKGITEETLKTEVANVADVLKNTTYQPVQVALERSWQIHGICLKGFAGLLNWQTQTNTRFVQEISDRVRVIACLTELPNLVDSDNHHDTISSNEWREVMATVNASNDDAVVVVWGDERDSKTAINEVIIRVKEATIGIPSETRQAYKNGKNGFERILPGADRMYPDTDLPPECITEKRIERITAELPKDYWTREVWYRELKLPEDVIVPLSISPYARLFEQLVKEKHLDPVLVSVALIQFPKRLKKQGLDITKLDENNLKKVFDEYKAQQLPRDALLLAMKRIIQEHGFTNTTISGKCDEQELEKIREEAERELASITLRDSKNYARLLIGSIMTKLRGRVHPSDVITATTTQPENAG